MSGASANRRPSFVSAWSAPINRLARNQGFDRARILKICMPGIPSTGPSSGHRIPHRSDHAEQQISRGGDWRRQHVLLRPRPDRELPCRRVDRNPMRVGHDRPGRSDDQLRGTCSVVRAQRCDPMAVPQSVNLDHCGRDLPELSALLRRGFMPLTESSLTSCSRMRVKKGRAWQEHGIHASAQRSSL